MTRAQAQLVTNEINAVLKAHNVRLETDSWSVFVEDGYEPLPIDLYEPCGDGVTTVTLDPE